MGIFDSIKNIIKTNDEELEEIQELEVSREEAKAISSYEEPKTKINKLNSNTKMVLFEPRSFDEVEEIARHLKQKRACVVNLHKLQRDYAQRTMDFLTGTVFALDGTIQKIAHNTVLLTPESVEVDGEISLDSNE